MKYIFLVLLTLLTGCSVWHQRPPMLTMHADVEFTMPERLCIESSADKWREQTSGIADIKVLYDYDPKDPTSWKDNKANDKLVRWTSDMEIVKQFDDVAGGNLLGQVSRFNGEKPIEMRLVADRLGDGHMCRLTAIHEFGHVFGISHLGKPTDIMYPVVIQNRSECLKSEDLLMFCFVNNCDKVKMKPCPDDPGLDTVEEVEGVSDELSFVSR